MLITGNLKKDELIKNLTLLLEEDGFFFIEEMRSSLVFKKGIAKGIVGAGEYVCIHDIYKDDVCFIFSVQKSMPYSQSSTSEVYSNYEFAFSFITKYCKLVLEILSSSQGLTFKLHHLNTDSDGSHEFIMIGYDKMGISKKTISIRNMKTIPVTATI